MGLANWYALASFVCFVYDCQVGYIRWLCTTCGMHYVWHHKTCLFQEHAATLSALIASYTAKHKSSIDSILPMAVAYTTTEDETVSL